MLVINSFCLFMLWKKVLDLCVFFSLHLHSGMDIRIFHDIGVDLDL